MDLETVKLLANVGIAGAALFYVLRILGRELPKIADHLAAMNRRLERLLERRRIPESDPPPRAEDDTDPAGRRLRRRFSLRLPTAREPGED